MARPWPVRSTLAFRIMCELYSEPGALTTADVAEELDRCPSYCTDLVALLRDRGHVERCRGQSRPLLLTCQGLAHVRHVMGIEEAA